jgi:hypothetical protein
MEKEGEAANIVAEFIVIDSVKIYSGADRPDWTVVHGRC